MILLSKNVVVRKTREEVRRIVQSSAYYLPKGRFSEESFSMHCARRFNGGIISLIPVTGTITQHNQSVYVTLSINGGFGFYLGCCLFVLGVLGMLWCVITHSSRWIPSVGMILLGLLVSGQFIWEGKALLDRLENKLLG